MNAPAPRTGRQLILEGIVTTTNSDGTVNVAPMGPVVDREMRSLRLRPFSSSTTYQNLRRTQRGIFHVTDDATLLATAAIGQLQMPAMEYLPERESHVISNCCRWYAFDVERLDDSKDRVEIECSVVQSADLRPFFGWNRAMHSVLEAAILATRVGLLSIDEIQSKLAPLAVIVEKTASDKEREAFRIISDYVARQ